MATKVKLTTALDLQGTAQSDDIFGLSRNDSATLVEAVLNGEKIR